MNKKRRCAVCKEPPVGLVEFAQHPSASLDTVPRVQAFCADHHLLAAQLVDGPAEAAISALARHP